MKPISARRARTRARLLESASEVIREKGLHAATLDEIATRAGLTKGAIYDNYASKDELFIELARTQPLRLRWPEDRSGSAADRLARLARAILADDAVPGPPIPNRAEYLLYLLTHDEARRGMADVVAADVAYAAARTREMFAPGELPMTPETFALLLEALTPSLLFIRALAPKLVTEATVAAMLAGLA